MGWTPKRGRPPTGATEPAPSPRARRRAQRPEDISTPRLDAAAKASPKEATGAKPEPGRNNGNRNTVPTPEDKDMRVRAKVRLGKRWSEILFAIKAGEYTWREFVDGLDDEELARGQLRSSDGGFRGRPPSMVPREFLLACQREHRRRFEEIFGSEVLDIARQYVKLAQNTNLKEETRAKMMQYAMERIFGGIPKDVRVSQEQPWEQMMVNIVSDGDTGIPEHLRNRYAGYAERQGSTPEEE